MEEIEKNDFNLNISRYISTAETEQEIELAATHAELVMIEASIRAATDKHNEFLRELGCRSCCERSERSDPDPPFFHRDIHAIHLNTTPRSAGVSPAHSCRVNSSPFLHPLS
jgi:hypothetical protein